jgi:tetratricopeptide (TPR) repeat protein/tRNA A-37 threonylcarbamoyl transferase component Bud32
VTAEDWERMDARLRAAIGSAAEELAEGASVNWRGRAFGNYRIEERIAAGGMGVVFKARRADAQFEREVALKVLNSPLASEDARRRFRTERQILATFNHPHIAQLLDGGTTEEGLPYLVMEYIEGLPIDVYCERNRLSTADRLRLFVQVCAAVQCAHQHLIVHRDIKPSNILVTEDGVPKLLDFGIAKLLDTAGAASANLTVADARLLTPRNASPEQMRGSAITTASDVYSLGVLLYELLTERQPYEVCSLTPIELERAICETQVEPPSRFARHLAGDLDLIVMTALRKEPERRYATARQLADDIERQLEHRPIAARADTLGYRAGKFLERHAWSAATALAVVVAITGLVTIYTIQLARERDQTARERATAEEVSTFLEGLFEDANPGLSRPDVTARQVVEGGAARIEQLRGTQPVVASRLMLSMARAYAGLGLYERSYELARDSHALRQDNLRRDDPGIAEALHYVGVAQALLRQHEEALATLEEALRQREAALGPDALPVGQTLYRIGFVQHRIGNYPQMGAALRRALPIHERQLDPDDPVSAEVRRLLGIYYYLVSDHAAAREALQRSLRVQERAYGKDSIRIVDSLQALGRLEWQLGAFAQAIDFYSRALAIKETHFGREHPDLGATLYGLAVSSKDLGALSDSRAYYERVIALQTKVLGPDDFYLALSLSGYGFLQLDLGDYDLAKSSLTRSLAIAEKKWGPRHPDLRAPLAGLAKVLVEQGEFATARAHLERALAIVQPQFPPEHVDVVRTLSSIATVDRRSGDHARARPQFEEALARFARGVGTKHPFATEALLGMGEVLKAAGELDRAEKFYGAALANQQGPYSDRKPIMAETLSGYADLLRRLRRNEEASAAEARGARVREYLRAERAKAVNWSG